MESRLDGLYASRSDISVAKDSLMLSPKGIITHRFWDAKTFATMRMPLGHPVLWNWAGTVPTCSSVPHGLSPKIFLRVHLNEPISRRTLCVSVGRPVSTRLDIRQMHAAKPARWRWALLARPQSAITRLLINSSAQRCLSQRSRVVSVTADFTGVLPHEQSPTLPRFLHKLRSSTLISFLGRLGGVVRN